MSSPGKNDPCFIVASDSSYRILGDAPVCDELGAFLFLTESKPVAESLVELYYSEHGDREFDLTIVPRNSLNTIQRIRAQRELRAIESIALNLSSDDYRTEDPACVALAECALTLERLEPELLAVFDSSSACEPRADSYLNKHCLLPKLTAPHSLDEALDRLIYALERHRLLFLYFASAVRWNPASIAGPTGIREQVCRDEVVGYSQFMQSVDAEGEFLFSGRSFLDRYADAAVSRFGPGEGIKPKGEGTSYPYWALEEGGAAYMEESADAIHTCGVWLRTHDSRNAVADIVAEVIDIAHDQGQSRWYSSVATRWSYLGRLEGIIAATKRARVRHAAATPRDSSPLPTESFYLEARYCTVWCDYPGSDSTASWGEKSESWQQFYAIRDADIGQRLVRFFEMGPRTQDDEHETVEVSFRCQAASTYDDDRRFLIDEDLADTRSRVEKAHRLWRAEQCLSDDSDERPPLTGGPLTKEWLFDQARRWHAGLTKVPEDDAAKSEPANTTEDAASDGILRKMIPTAVIAAAGLRDLLRVRKFYPEAIPAEEAEAIEEQLRSALSTALEFCHLQGVTRAADSPEMMDTPADLKFGMIAGLLVLHHPEFKGDAKEPDEIEVKMEAGLKRCREDVSEPVRGLVERIGSAMLYDCRVPTPVGLGEFREPQRFSQMLRMYWRIVRQLLIDQVDALASYRPHPLASLIINYKARIEACLDQLQQFDDVVTVKQHIDDLLESLINGDPDEFDSDWSFGQIGFVDRFIENARLILGSKSYQLTPAEESSIRHAEESVASYLERVKADRAKMFGRWKSSPSAKATAMQSNPSAVPTPVTAQESQTDIALEVDPIEELLDNQPLNLYRFLKGRSHSTTYDTLRDKVDLWRTSSPDDATIHRALRRLRAELNKLESGPHLTIQHKVRRVRLDKSGPK